MSSKAATAARPTVATRRRWVARLALDELDDDPLLDASFYPGDLLLCLLRLQNEFLKDNWDIKNRLVEIADAALDEIESEDASMPHERADEIRRLRRELEQL